MWLLSRQIFSFLLPRLPHRATTFDLERSLELPQHSGHLTDSNFIIRMFLLTFTKLFFFLCLLQLNFVNLFIRRTWMNEWIILWASSYVYYTVELLWSGQPSWLPLQRLVQQLKTSEPSVRASILLSRLAVGRGSHIHISATWWRWKKTLARVCRQ